MQEEENKVVYDIEKMVDLKKAMSSDTIVFDNKGEMHKDNRQYKREKKRLWRSVNENRTVRFFTKKHNKTSKSSKKRERQNRKKGRK